MKRPATVWLLSTLIILDMIWTLLGTIGLMTGLVLPMSPYLVVSSITNLILVVFSGFLVYHFFMLKKKAEMWTHITLGYVIIIGIFKDIFISPIMNTYLGVPSPNFIFIILGTIVYLLIWWAIVAYIRKKKINEQLLFN